MINKLCTPAFIYLIFGIHYIIMSIFNSAYFMAMKQFLMTLLFATLLNMLCERNMTIFDFNNSTFCINVKFCFNSKI